MRRSALLFSLLVGCGSAASPGLGPDKTDDPAVTAKDPFADLRPRTLPNDFAFTSPPDAAVRLPGEFEPVRQLIVTFPSSLGGGGKLDAFFLNVIKAGAEHVPVLVLAANPNQHV